VKRGIHQQHRSVWQFSKGKKKESFLERLENLPANFFRSIFRHNYPSNDVDRSEIVFKNFFLHIHPVKCHKTVVDPFHTLGLGTITASFFFLLVFTGVVLMFFYVPAVDRAYTILVDWLDTTPFAMMWRNVHRWSAQLMVLFVFFAYEPGLLHGGLQRGAEV